MNYSVLSKYRTELMGLAMLWVMLFHAWDLDLILLPLNWLRSAGFGGVDIFIFLSAMGLAMSLNGKEQKFGPFMARRASRILPAYYVVMLAYAAFSILRDTAPVSALFWNSTLLAYWVRAEGGFNWYISGILLFYALTPPCFRLLKRSRHRELLTAAGMTAGLALSRVLIRFIWGWSYLDVAYRVPIFFLGLLIGFYAGEARPLGTRSLLFWCFCTLCGAAFLAASLHIDVSVAFLPLAYLFIFTTVPLCLALCLLFERLPLGGLRRLLRLVGENSLEIYLLNVTFFTETALLRRYLDFGPGHYVYYLITISSNIALGVLLHRAIELGRARFRARRSKTGSVSSGS